MAKTKPFESYSDQYDHWFTENSDVYDLELEAIKDLIPTTAVKQVEVGVGSGKFAFPLEIQLGVEPCQEMAKKAKRLGIEVLEGVAENLPLNDGEFDLVLMVTTICFVDDPLQSFKECYRVLKPGGVLVVGFVDKLSSLGQRYEANKKESVFYQDATFFSTTEVVELMKKGGFASFTFRQTLIPGEAENLVQSGHGKGAFVAVAGKKD